MAAIKKGTKLTDKPKDYMLRVRMDEETLDKLLTISGNAGVGKSALIRRLIEEEYQKKQK